MKSTCLLCVRILSRCGILAALLSGAVHAQSTTSSTCPALAFNNPAPLAWDQDTSYELTVRAAENGRLRITVVGDILVLDKARFGNLLREVDKAPENVDEVILDAREVHISEPLSLQRGLIRVFAQTVSFSGRGLLAVTKAASQSDGIEVFARRLDFSKAQPVPLQVTVHESRAHQARSAVVEFHAYELVTAQGVLKGFEARERLWRYSSNYDGVMPVQLPESWEAHVGQVGYVNGMELVGGRVAWPGYTSFKLRKHFTIAPFDAINKAQLFEKYLQLRPLFVRMGQADAIRQIDTVSLLMQQNLDDRGWGPSHVSSEDFLVAKARLKRSLSEADVQLSRLQALVVSAQQSPRLDDTQIVNVRSQIASFAAAEKQHQANISEHLTRLAALQAEGVEVAARIAGEHEESRQELERRKKRAKDGDNIRVGTTVLAIGASFIGTPATGAAIAATVSTAGDFVYAHNAGKAVNFQDLISIGQKNAELYKTLKNSRNAWDQYKQDWDVMQGVFNGKRIILKGTTWPLTKAKAAEMTGKSAVAFARQVKAVNDELGAIPRPDLISLNEVEAGNTELVEALGRLANIQQSIGEVAGHLKQSQAELAAAEAAMAKSLAVERVLLELKPVNDQEVLRWKTAALELWSREVQQLYSDVRGLRRSLYFETWKAPALPASFATYPEEVISYLATGRYSPEAPNANSPASITEKHLTDERAKHLAVLWGIYNSVEKAWNDYQAERAAGAQPYFDPQEFVRREGAPVVTQLFLDQLNAQIKHQIEFPAARGTRRFPLLIPIEMAPPPDPDLPERLLRAGVANVRFKNPKALVGKQIYFYTTYKLAGELYRNGRCAYVDLAVPGGKTSVTLRDQQSEDPGLTAIRQEAQLPLTFRSLSESRASPPARTLYFLSVVVSGSPDDTNWLQVPEIEGFTFWRRLVQ